MFDELTLLATLILVINSRVHSKERAVIEMMLLPQGNDATVDRATSHLGVRLTSMSVTVNEVSSHLCNIFNTNYSQNISADRREPTALLDAQL